MNASEKIKSDELEAECTWVIKDGAPDFIALKDHGDYWEIIFVEVKTNRLPLQRNQKRAIAILRKLEGKPVKVTVRVSRVLTNPDQSMPDQANPTRTRPDQPTPLAQTILAQARPSHAKPIHPTPFHARPHQPTLLQTRPDDFWGR